MKLCDYGRVWEGQAFHPGVYPSIYGVGEGAAFFGLNKCVYMFHPNNELAMEKLMFMDDVVCDVAKWNYFDILNENGGYRGLGYKADGGPDGVCREIETVGALKQKYPNITGVYHDDMQILAKRYGCAPADYIKIADLAHSVNPSFKLWTCVYAHELDEKLWRGYAPYIDVVNLWVWESKDLTRYDFFLENCRAIFPNKPINAGVYLRDYHRAAPVEMPLLKLQMEKILRCLQDGLIEGFSILGAVLIDGQTEQARWARDFIKAHS